MKLSAQRVRSLVDGAFTIVPQRCTATEIVFICPVPGCKDESGNRSVNVQTLKTNCWKCGNAGNFIPWAARLGYDFDTSNADLYETRQLDDLSEDLDGLGSARKTTVAYVNNIELPKGFIQLKDEPQCGYARLIEKMAIRKNLDLDTFIRAGAGFTRTDPYWEPFCIFPVYEWGRVVYYQGRTYTDPKRDPVTGKKPSTKQFPSKSSIKLGSRYWVYNIDKLRNHGRIAIVVESMFNVFSLENALGDDSDIVPIAIFKHKISPEQQAKILTASGVREIVLMFDPDAISSSWESCSKLANLVKVTVADRMPDGVDPNDDVQEALRCFDRRKAYSAINDLDRLVDGL